MTPAERLAELTRLWPDLTEDQQALLHAAAEDFARPLTVWRNSDSDVVWNDRILYRLGDYLKIHHVLSAEPFRKEKFEYALKRIYADEGSHIEQPVSRTGPYDLLVNNQKWSIKTQADRNIRRDILHISKLMELGAVKWTKDPESLIEVLEFALGKLNGVNRVLVLRCLTPTDLTNHEYELIEIPISIFFRARGGEIRVSPRSRQNPPIANCVVRDDQGDMYEFYFDGGTEMKLQVKKLRWNLCVIHAI